LAAQHTASRFPDQTMYGDASHLPRGQHHGAHATDATRPSTRKATHARRSRSPSGNRATLATAAPARSLGPDSRQPMAANFAEAHPPLPQQTPQMKKARNPMTASLLKQLAE